MDVYTASRKNSYRVLDREEVCANLNNSRWLKASRWLKSFAMALAPQVHHRSYNDPGRYALLLVLNHVAVFIKHGYWYLESFQFRAYYGQVSHHHDHHVVRVK
ncbi:MAG: hypothetical protein ACI9R7_001586 [Lysobacterales bacterium]|jgi:hypothetical protein